MGKTAFLFSGQGSQYPGMGAELYAAHPAARRIYDMASEVLGYDLIRLSSGSDAEQLARTGVSQPLIFTLSLAAFAVATEAGLKPDAAAGFSLGECTALAAAGAMAPAVGFEVIKRRAAAMQQAAERSHGAMYAIIGKTESEVETACGAVSGFAAPVNYNCPGQIVIAGEASSAAAAAAALEAAGAKVAKLAVNAAFHSKLMEEAAETFYQGVKDFEYRQPAFPLYSNVTGDVWPMGDIPLYLKKQMTSPVRFNDEMSALMRDGFDTFIELGPGKTLCGFVRRGIKGARTYHIEDMASLEKCLSSLT